MNQNPNSSSIYSDKQIIETKKIILLILGVLAYFSVMVLSTASTAKTVSILMLLCAIVVIFMKWSVIRSRLSIPFMVLTLWVTMNGISTLYAVSGKFALKGFELLLTSFSIVIFALAFANGEKKKLGRGFASIISGASAVAGLVSIDFLSTHIISTPVLSFFGLFTDDYANIAPVEEGIRMISIFQNPNVFAGCMGIGVFLSLGLAITSTQKERIYHICCLFLNAMAFLLAFSMGASGMILLGFIVYLILDRNRGSSLVLMVETLILSVISAFAISATSFTAWTEPRPVPLICAIVGCVMLCLLDKFVGQKIAGKLQKHIKLIPIIIALMFVLLGVFAVVAMNVTGEATLNIGETFRRSQYPDAGTYTLSVKSDAPVNVTIESQNKEDTMMHTNTVIYQGVADGAVFEVPEDSIVIYANFSSDANVTIEEAVFNGDAGSYSFPLKYKLLPDFISNRMQGLWANQNAIQRTVFFEDGMKLFKRSPVIGLGMGAYENAVVSVQEFFYETKYAHNHYIQSLVEVGVIGLVLFVGVLGTSAVAVVQTRRKSEEQSNPLTAALGGALVFMAGHAAVEVIFSMYSYLPMAFGIFGLITLCCGDTLSLKKISDNIKNWITLIIAILMIVYAGLMLGNIYARYKVDKEQSLDSLVSAIKLDRFEWADYMTSYVYSAIGIDETQTEIKKQADIYAKHLKSLDSNTVPIVLAEYYFSNGNIDDGFDMIEKYLAYGASDQEKWEQAFTLMVNYYIGEDEYISRMKNIYDMLQEWNSQNMGQIVLSDMINTFIQMMGINK